MTDLPPELPDAAEFKRFLRTDSVAAPFLAEQTVHEIAEAYRQKTGRMPQIFLGGQSPGAAAFGSERL